MVVGHVDRHLPDSDRAFDADRDVVRIIGYPDGHFFTPFEHGALDQQGSEFDGAELGVGRANGLFTKIADIEMVDLPVEEHIEGDLVVYLEVAEVDVTGIENGAAYVLDAVGHFKYAGFHNGRIGGLVKTDVLICFISALIDVANELIGLQSSRINIRFVLIPYFKEFIIERVGFSLTDDVIDILTVEMLECGIEGSFTGSRELYAGNRIRYLVSQVFARKEGFVTNAATKRRGFVTSQQRKRKHHQQ